MSRIVQLAAVSLLFVLPSAGRAEGRDIERYIARAEIEDLITRYTYAFDALDADAYVRTFTEDAVFDLGGGDVRKGRDGIRSIITERQAKPPDPATLEHHVITNSLIEFVADDRVHHRAYWLTIIGDFAHGFAVPAMGKYDDVIVKRNGEWLIESRRLVLPEGGQ